MGLAQITGLLTGNRLPSFKSDEIDERDKIEQATTTTEEDPGPLQDRFSVSDKLKSIQFIAKRYDVRAIQPQDLGDFQQQLLNTNLLTATKPNQARMIQLAVRDFNQGDNNGINILESMHLYSDQLSLQKPGYHTLKDAKELVSVIQNLDAFHRDLKHLDSAKT